MTPRVERHLAEHAAGGGYRRTAASLGEFGTTISHTDVGRKLARLHEEMHSELFGPDATVDAPSTAPPNRAEVLLIEADGSRYRTNEADVPRRGPSTPPEDRGWRENKAAVVARVLPGEGSSSPRELMKTFVATTGDVDSLGRDLRVEADRRGVGRAKVVVALSDNGHGIPSMLERHFGDIEVNRVTDFYHSAGRLADVAEVAAGPTDRRRKRRLFQSLRDDLWHGRTRRLQRRLRGHARRRSRRPERLADLAQGSDGRRLWEHAMYFEKFGDTMDYPSYRARGWPIGSGSVESACGRIGERVKHARMRWTRPGANALHTIKAAMMSEDGRWERRWPAPIPILETAPVAHGAN